MAPQRYRALSTLAGIVERCDYCARPGIAAAVTDVRPPQAAHLYRLSADSHPPAFPRPRTDEAPEPAQPVQVIQVVGIGPEPGLELSRGPRVVQGRPGPEHNHGLSLVRSDEYP